MPALLFLLPANAQNPCDLLFQNGTLSAGSPGADNAVYYFAGINTRADAYVKIKGRSGLSVVLNNIDQSGTGYPESFQPQISIGNLSGAASWWMEFEVNFVKAGTTMAISFPQINASGIDIDGNGTLIREQVAFYGASSCLLESISSLTVSNVTGTISQPTMAGFRFNGPLNNYPGMDSAILDIIGTARYINTNTITFRIGGVSGGATADTERDYSIRFRDISASSPLTTLPVSFASYTATLNADKKVELQWTTSTEINTAYFEIERSTDGIQYNRQGMVLAVNNINNVRDYRFTEVLGWMSAGIIWYRIRSVDQDGRSMVSGARMIRISDNSDMNPGLILYPNPVKRELSISIPANWQDKILLYEIVTISGQVVNRFQRKSSSQTEVLDIQSLAAGHYSVLVRCEGKVISERLIKL